MMSFSAILFLKTPVSDIRLQRCPAEKEGAANIQEEPSNLRTCRISCSQSAQAFENGEFFTRNVSWILNL